jgi:putative transposase
MAANTMLLREDTRIDWKGRGAVIRSAQPDFLVLEFDDKTKQMVEGDKAYDAYMHGELTLVESVPSVVYMPLTDPKHIYEANRLSSYLKELDSREHSDSKRTRDSVINSVSIRIHDDNPPSEGALYRYRKAWIKANKNIIPLIIKPKQQRKKQIAQKQLDLAYEVIDDEYLKHNGSNPSQTYIRFKNRFKAEIGGKPMCKTSFDNIINTLDEVEVILAREGKEALRRHARKNNEIFITDFMMQQVEIDAVHLSLGLTDDNGKFLGTVILYLAIDVHTRYIVGYKLRYGHNVAEESGAVIDLLKHISLPKMRNGNYQSTWYDLGPPCRTVGDAGKAFCSNIVIAFSAMIGSSHDTTQAGSPWKKPYIERFNRTLRSSLMTKIPGYFGRRVDGNTLDGTIEQKACVSVAKFTKYLEEFICDYYHKNPHKGLNGLTPQQAVESELGLFKPRPIPNVALLDAFTGVERPATIQKQNGIQVNKVTYRNDELKSLYNRLVSEGKDRKVIILYNQYDISQITVIMPDDLTMLVVPCRNTKIKSGTSLKAYQAGLPVQTEEVKAFPSKHNEHAPKKKKPRKKKGKIKPTEASNQAYTKEELEKIQQEGKGRFGQDHTNKSLKSTSNNDPSTQTQTSSTRRKRNKVI